MKTKPILYGVALTLLLCSCSPTKNQYQATKNYQPDDQKLYREIVSADSTFFQAYNTCDKNLKQYAAYFLDDIEFYHDKGGLITSKTELVHATQKNVCGKVSRELVKGSIEVYPIKNFGAVEIGLHQFHNSAEPDAISKPARFMIVWKSEAQQWKISRVVSLH